MIIIPPCIGATQLVARVEDYQLRWRCPACGASNADAAVLLHESDCVVEQRIVAALRRFEIIFQVRA